MERAAWTDERIDDAFAQLRAELRDMREEMRAGFADVRAEMRSMRSDFGAETRSIRAELFQLKLFMLAGLVTILTAVIALHG
jgi:hypothetical protein